MGRWEEYIKLPKPCKSDKFSRMKEARFRFAIENLQRVLLIKPREDFLFSPESIYEIFFCFYMELSDNADTNCKNDLQTVLYLSNVPKRMAQTYQSYVLKKRTKMEKSHTKEVYCKLDCMGWIKNFRFLKKNTLENCEIYKLEDVLNFDSLVMSYINKSIRQKVNNHISYTLEFDPWNFNEDTEFILANFLCLKDSPRNKKEKPSSSNLEKRHCNRLVVSSKLGLEMTEIALGQNISIFYLLPIGHISNMNISRMSYHDDISRLVNRLATIEGMRELRKLLDGNMSANGKKELRYFELNMPMNEILSIVDTKKIFLRGFLTNAKTNLNVNRDVHWCSVKVTPEEIIANAFTATFTDNKINSPSTMINRSYEDSDQFIWLIYDKSEQTILFIGAKH